MRISSMRIALLAALALVVAACGGAGAPTTAAPTAPVSATMPGGSPPPGAPQPSPAAGYLTTQLTDVRTGEQFTLGQLAVGKQVLVQGMAVW